MGNRRSSLRRVQKMRDTYFAKGGRDSQLRDARGFSLSSSSRHQNTHCIRNVATKGSSYESREKENGWSSSAGPALLKGAKFHPWNPKKHEELRKARKKAMAAGVVTYGTVHVSPQIQLGVSKLPEMSPSKRGHSKGVTISEISNSAGLTSLPAIRGARGVGNDGSNSRVNADVPPRGAGPASQVRAPPMSPLRSPSGLAANESSKNAALISGLDPKLASLSDGLVNSGKRPLSTMSSITVDEQEVDDLLNWTKNLDPAAAVSSPGLV